jgi:endoglucanase
MNKWIAFCLLTVLLVACQPIQPTDPVAPAAAAGMPLDIFAINQQLGRGVNLGNALEAPNDEGEWGMRLQADFFTLIADAGFTSVRVPIRWSAHAAATAPYPIDTAFFERIDWVIAQAKANKLAAVINMHHYEEMISDPDGHTERFLALWQQIAERYKDEPPTILFELLNEPNGPLTAVKWNQILAQGIATVRRSNPTRAIIVGPVQWNNIGYIDTLHLPKDPNLIVSFHYYDPFQFTHQGAEWVDGATGWLGTTWDGTSFQQSAITTAFDAAATWAKRQNRPLFLGEFGAYSKADLASRERWTAFVTQTAVEREMSLAYWEFGAGFGVYDRTRGEWNQGLLDALLK